MKSWRSKFSLTPKRLAAIAAAGLLVLGILYAYGRVSNSGISFQVSSDADHEFVGIPFEIRATLTNDSDSFIKNGKASMRLPEGVRFASGDDRVIGSIDLGDVRPGEIREEAFTVVVVSPGEGVKTFETFLEYSLGQVSAKFQKQSAVRVAMADFPVSLEFRAPETILASQPFDFSIVYKNLHARSLPAFKIKLDHPGAFSFTPAESEGVWEIESLPPGREGEIKLAGKADLPDDASLGLALKVLLSLGDRQHAILSKLVSWSVMPSPLSLKIYNDEEREIYEPGSRMNYSVNYRNNTEMPIQNGAVTVKLTGTMFDFQTLALTNASFNPVTRTIAWTSQSNEGLKSIPPGGGGILKFSISIKSAYPIKKINDKNFSLRADAKITGAASGTGQVEGIGSTESKIPGRIDVKASAYFRDAPSLILNSGPWPPKVGQTTEFTIHWTLTNYATDVSNVEVKASLPDGVVLSGKIKSNWNSVPEINADSGEIIWRISKLFATTGVLSAKPEAIFQVKATPTQANVGNYMILLEPTEVTALDLFTNQTLTALDSPATTRLSADSSVKEGEGIVTR